jgi:hypothetical protein
MLDMYAEDATLDVSAVFSDVAPIHGHHDMLRYWISLRETWKGLRLDPVEVFDLSGDRFAVDTRLWTKGRSSGAELDQRYVFVYTLRADEKVVLAELVPNLEAAKSA